MPFIFRQYISIVVYALNDFVINTNFHCNTSLIVKLSQAKKQAKFKVRAIQK